MATATHISPEAFLGMDLPEDGTRYELSQGEIVTVGQAGTLHEFVKGNVLAVLFAWRVLHPEARIFAESLFRLGDDTARMPDIAVMLSDRLALVPVTRLILSVTPNLAVEILSPSENVYDAEVKVRQYLASGVEEIWQIYPEQLMVRVRRMGYVADFESNAAFTSGVLGDLKIEVQSFFV